MNVSRTVFAVLLLAGFATETFAADPPARWPQFRGVNGSGVAADRKPLPVKFGPATNRRWRTVLPPGVSCPCLWGDRIFLTGYHKDIKTLETLCLDRNTGKILWRKRVSPKTVEKTHPVNSPAAPTPATDGERVYVYFGSVGLLCYDFHGKQLWQKRLPMPKNRHGTGSSPIVVGDLVILCCDQGMLLRPQGSFLLAVNRKTGKQVWRTARPFNSAGWTTPVVWKHDDDRELIVLGRRVTSYDLKTGKERWWLTGLMDYSVTVPVVGDGLLYVEVAAGGFDAGSRMKLPSFGDLRKKYDADKDGTLARKEVPADLAIYKGDSGNVPGDSVSLKEAFPLVDANKDGQISATEWTLLSFMMASQQNKLLAVRPGKTGDVTRTNVAWTETRRLPEVPSALHYRGRLYLVKNGGIVSCLDAKTGKLQYRKRLGVTANYFASPVAGDGKIYASSHTGTVVVFSAGDFRVLARNKLNESIVATPAIAGGVLYVRTANALYAFGK